MRLNPNELSTSVEMFPASAQVAVVSDELNRILVLLREACPHDARISFDFDGTLHVHIDVRKREDASCVATLLPGVRSGLFEKVRLGQHRITPFFTGSARRLTDSLKVKRPCDGQNRTQPA